MKPSLPRFTAALSMFCPRAGRRYLQRANSKLCFLKYKIEFLPVELQGFKKKKITMGNDIETSEPLWFALFFHCLK